MVKTSAEYDRQRIKPRVTITMDRNIRHRADKYADRTGTSLSLLIELALGEYLRGREAKIRGEGTAAALRGG